MSHHHFCLIVAHIWLIGFLLANFNGRPGWMAWCAAWSMIWLALSIWGDRA